MAYQVYTTPAIIISQTISGESNKTLDVFSRDFGRISVNVQNGSGLSSKLRLGLQTLQNPTVSVLKGRYKWRCLGVEAGNLPLTDATTQARVAWQQVLRVVHQLVPYQVAQPEVYELLINNGKKLLLASSSNVTFPLMQTLANILDYWGYFNQADWLGVLHNNPSNKQIVMFTKEVHNALYKAGVTNLQVVYSS